jgi:hypothetical protein
MKELEDFAWFPNRLRRWQMDFIGSLALWLRLYRPLVPVAQQLLRQTKGNRITDCCSGSGIPAIYLHRQLPPGTVTLLSDKFPQPFAGTDGVAYQAGSCDLLQLQPVAGQLYTLYNAFHHFTTAEQLGLLQRFARSGAPCLIAEILEPGPFNLIKILFATTVGQVLAAPFVRPFDWMRLACTWLLPINLVTVTYDGLVSVLKSKTARQYAAMATAAGTTGYTFTVKRIWRITGPVTYLAGSPNT